MTTRGWGWAVCVLAMAAVAQPASGQGGDDSKDAVNAVRAILSKQADDWNKGDLDGFLTGYWNSPKVVFMSGGQRFDGFEAMRDRYRRRYKAEGRAMGQLVFSELDVDATRPRIGFRADASADDARRHKADRVIHGHSAQASRWLENRARSHVDRTAGPKPEGREMSP